MTAHEGAVNKLNTKIMKAVITWIKEESDSIIMMLLVLAVLIYAMCRDLNYI